MGETSLRNTNLSDPTGWLKDILIITIVLGGIFFICLGSPPLLVPEEGRYAEIIREMWSRQEYVTPTLDYVKYFEKPVMFYWLGILFVKNIGLSVWTLRSVNAVFAVFGCLFTYFAGRKLYNRWTGLYAAFILSGNILYFGLAHVINVDITATFFMSVSLFSFLLGVQQAIGIHRRLFIWLAFLAAGCAVLTKGLVGFIFPIMIVGVWMVILNQWRLIKSLYLPSAFLIFLLVVVPWHWLVSVRNPEFFYFYFIEQQLFRYATTSIGHLQPIWFFIPVLIGGFFPWICFLPQSLLLAWKTIQQKNSLSSTTVFLLSWIAVIFIFFSFSKSKLVSYVLPMFPALAVLVGRYLQQSSYQWRQLGMLWFVTIVLFFAFQKAFMLHNTLSTRPFIKVLQQRLSPMDEVVAYKLYFQDLPFYLARRVTVVDWRGELLFGSQHQNTKAWLIDEKTFWQRWHRGKHFYVLTDHDEFGELKTRYPREKICAIESTDTLVLFTHC